MFDPLVLLSLIVFLPAVGAIVLAFVPRSNEDLIRYITLGFTIAVLAVCVVGFFGTGDTDLSMANGWSEAHATMQGAFNRSWIPSFNIYYFMGIDGISFPLIMLTAVVSVLAMGASWSIKKQVKGYCILFLLLETGMLGVFLALDFFLFYVFWEVMLLPMYFLIGIWGGPRREYAAIKFFLYTLVGSVLMLIAILMIYFHSDLRQVVAVSDLVKDGSRVSWERLHIPEKSAAAAGITIAAADPVPDRDAALMLIRTGDDLEHGLTQPLPVTFVVDADTESVAVDGSGVTVSLTASGHTATDAARVINNGDAFEFHGQVEMLRAKSLSGGGEILAEHSLDLAAADKPARTFNLLALAAIGQHTDSFDGKLLFGWSLQVWAFLLLFIGFAIKVPAIPVHTWLPDAHVEAPTPISMILAGVLLKMGGYGIIRICYPICPAGGYALTAFVCTLGAASMVYGAFAAMAQTDFKRLVAYSSVSHMGYVVLGLGVWSARDYGLYNSDYWNMGVQGAMFQMIAHGISSTGMFFMVGVIYDRVHHRNLNEFGGLFTKMPVYSALAVGIFFAGLGLPGLCGFVGEVFVVLSVFQYSAVLAIISASVVILTAGYILWAIQRVYLGAEYKGPHEEALVPATLRENAIATVIFVLAILLGVLPYHTVLRYMDSTITQQVDDLTDWTKRHEPTLADSDHEADSHEADSHEAEAQAENAGGVAPAANDLSDLRGTPALGPETNSIANHGEALSIAELDP